MGREIIVSGLDDVTVEYEFTVSGDLETLDDPGGDNVDGSTASGIVHGWKDGYAYTGEITSFRSNAPVEIEWCEGELSNDGTAIFTFDDGNDTALHNAEPVLSDFGFDATVVVITERPKDDPDDTKDQWTSYLTVQELEELQSAGWDIGSHTHHHTRLTDVSLAEARDELEQSRDWLQNRGFDADTFVYPRGGGNQELAELVGDVGYEIGFGGGGEEPPNYASRYRIGRYRGEHPDEVLDAIDQQSTQGGVVPIMLHQIVESNPGTYETTVSELRSYCEAIESAGMDVMTGSEFAETL